MGRSDGHPEGGIAMVFAGSLRASTLRFLSILSILRLLPVSGGSFGCISFRMSITRRLAQLAFKIGLHKRV